MSAPADGKHLFIRLTKVENDVLIANVGAGGVLDQPRRLTLDERTDIPYSWTADSKAVIFCSNRNGSMDIFRQSVDAEDAEPLVEAPGTQVLARATPDGLGLLFLSMPHESPGSAMEKGQVEIKFLPFGGGVPALLAKRDARPSNMACSKAGCVVLEREGQSIVVSELSPRTGKGRHLMTTPMLTAASLTPDGAFAQVAPDGRGVRFLALDGRLQRELRVQDARFLNSLDFLPDGSGFYASNRTAPGSSELLFVDMQGKSKVVYRAAGLMRLWAIPSPDGKKVAIMSGTQDANVWMLENF